MKLFSLLVFLLSSIGTCHADLAIEVINFSNKNIKLINSIMATCTIPFSPIPVLPCKVAAYPKDVTLEPGEHVNFLAKVWGG